MSSSERSNSQHKHRRSLAAYSATSINEARTKSILREREAQISQLRIEVAALTNQLQKVQKQQQQQQQSSKKSSHDHQSQSQSQSRTPKRKHRLSPFGNVVEADRYGALKHERSRMGRNASIATANELKSLRWTKEEDHYNSNHELVNRILEMFRDPSSHTKYLSSMDFAKDLFRLTKKIKGLFESEPRVAFVQSPAYVFGDIHGNLEDLHFFSDNVWRLGMSLTAGNFVFLGD